MRGEKHDPQSILNEALQISDAQQRTLFLDNACASDTVLREQVETLLAAPATAGRIVGPDDETLAAPGGSRGRASKSGSLPPSEQPGAVIGRYQLLRAIGEGGFGVVHLAEQREPVRRQVAMKIIKLGMDTRDVIARFEQERQALAMMDHPGIAKVLDAGATETGRPYFVMEYVQGVPLTEFCDEQNMPFSDRLKLFVQVCSAVQHAHQKGIIHRDLKPSNVLVTTVDGKPIPKVIDFGIAKATQQKIIDRTMYTGFGQFMGTPAYMSPEQADAGDDIDTRSDIYSLGVLLYELLTGATPFEMNTLRSASIDEVKRLIRDNDPPRPSTRLSTLGDRLPEVARLRGTESKKLGTTLRGDLDWIVMKALEKDRTRRYDTATDFARDIERFLNQEPILARPPTASYRMQKFVRRHRGAAVAVSIGLVALVGFATTMAVQAKRIAAERDRANHEREMSDRVVEFQADMLQGIQTQKLGESMVSDIRRRVDSAIQSSGDSEEQRVAALGSLDSAFARINLTDTARAVLDENILAPAAAAIDKQFSDQPEVQGRLEYALSKTYLGLGIHEKALAHSQKSLDIRRAAFGPDHRETLRVLGLQAMNLWELDRTRESGDILKKTVAHLEREFGPEDPDTLFAKLCLAVLEAERDSKAESVKRYKELLKVQERVLGPRHEHVASSLTNLGVVLLNQHQYAEAAEVLERSVSINIEVAGPDDPGTLFASQSLAKAYSNLGRWEEAERIQLDAVPRLEKNLGSRHPSTIEATANLTALYKAKGDLQKAEPLAQKTLEMCRTVHGNNHRRTISAIIDVGIILGLLGRHAEAEKYHIEAYELTRAIDGPDHPDTMARLNNLAVHYWYLGRYVKARELFEEILASSDRRFGKDHVETTAAMNNLAIVLGKVGRIDEAQSLAERAAAIRKKTYGTDNLKTFESESFVGQMYFDRKQFDSAQTQYSELLPRQKKVLGEEHPFTLQTMYNLALVLRELKRSDEALELMARAYEGRRRSVGNTHSETLDAAAELAGMKLDAGQPTEAHELLVEVIAARKAAASATGASPALQLSCAMILLICPVETLRNPHEALVFAQKAAEALEFQDAAALNVLARAYFETGDASKAVESQKAAIKLLPEGAPDQKDFQESLAKYAAGTQS